MENSIYIGLSKQVALRENMAIIANNVANMNTSGYRAQNILFKEYISDPNGAEHPISQVYNIGQYDNTESGSTEVTGNPLDLAINGPGFFGAVTNDGIRYTRAGNFTMDASGLLMMPGGVPVASAGGGTITIPAGTRDIGVTEDGFISADGGIIGQLMVQEFENPQSLTPEGNGLYRTTEDGIPAVRTVVKQGMLEGSNVNGVQEMTNLIDQSRSYVSLTKILDQEHERIRDSIRKLSGS